MATFKVQDINDPTFIRTVNDRSWKNWPKSKDHPGGKIGGKRTFVEVTDEEAAAAKAKEGQRNAPRIPPSVDRVLSAGAKIAMLKEAATAEEVDKILGDDVRPTVVEAANARKADLK